VPRGRHYPVPMLVSKGLRKPLRNTVRATLRPDETYLTKKLIFTIP
jgi:hypothetical protein